MSGSKGLHQCLLYINQKTIKKCAQKNVHSSVFGLKTSEGENAADQRRLRISTLLKSLSVPMTWNSYESFLIYVGSCHSSALHLTG